MANPFGIDQHCPVRDGNFLVQALDGWRGFKTIESISAGLNLTAAGKVLMVVLGLIGLVITGLLLSRLNWRSRDFNLKSQRRNIRLVNLPKGKPAVPVAAPVAGSEI